MRTSVAAALVASLLFAGASPAPAQEGPAPLPPDPSAKIKKAIEQALADWFKNEPSLPPPKGKSILDLKSARAKATGELETALRDWTAANKAAGGTRGLDPLRKTQWWRAALAAVPVQEAAKTGIQKQVMVITEKPLEFNIVTSVPNAYRPGKGIVYPLIVTVIDKEADPKKVLPAAYGDLLQSHIIVALSEDQVKGAHNFFFAMAWAALTHLVDRDRVVIDGIGRGAKWIDDAAPELALQLQGAVFRSPAKTSAVVANLSHIPCWAFQRMPATDATVAAVEGIRKASAKPEVRDIPGEPDDAALKAVQAWIAALPKRTIGDQTRPFSFTSARLRGLGQWAYWIALTEAAEEGPVSITMDRKPAENAIDITARNLGAATLLLNDEILDLDRPVKVRVNGIVVAETVPTRSLRTTFAYDTGLAKDLLGARDYFITAELPFEVTGDARIPEADRKAAADAAAAAAARAVKWESSWSSAVAASTEKKRPIFVAFDGEAGDAQSNLDAALARADVQDAVREFVCVRLPTSGDAGKEALELLAKLLAESKPPHAFLLSIGGEKIEISLNIGSLGDLEALAKAILDGVRPFLPAANGGGAPEAPKGAGPEAPKDPAPDAPAAAGETGPPIIVAWSPDWDAAVAKAKEHKLPLFAAFEIDSADPAQKLLDDVLKRRDVMALLQRFACVRVQTHGDAGKDGVKRLEELSPGAKAPLALARAAESTTDSTWTPTGDEEAQAKALLELLAKALPAPPAPPKPEEGKPAEEKPADPKPAEDKPPEAKPADAAK